jgi:hypothetical protein
MPAARPWLLAVVSVGLAVGGLLIGYEPVGGDPDRAFRPIKLELAAALREGRLPFWSDRFGLGVPLIAESQIAAFYPPNWALYRLLDVSAAYRVAMWLHHVAIAGATYAYGRRLRLSPWGSALAALAFALCGFQAIHASTEPFYSVLPLLPIALICSEAYLAGARPVWLAALAATWALQLAVGHFQIQMATGALVLLIAAWRGLAIGSPHRVLAVASALAVGAGIAAIQLVPSYEHARFVGTTTRSLRDLMYYAYPPAHWPELAIPRLFQGLGGGPEHRYWHWQATSGYEACLYVGTVPLILAFVAVAGARDRELAPWKLIVPASLALATMPHWWPLGYQLLLQLPGFGYFRAPARYTVITSLGLALLAGRGFDRMIAARRFSIGLALAGAFGAAGAVWALYWTRSPEYALAAGGISVWRSLGLATVAWIVSLTALAGWRAGKLPSVAVFVLAAIELGILYYAGPITWGRGVRLPGESPVLSRLAREPHGGTVAGRVDDLPVHANHPPTVPYFAMALPLPMRALGFSLDASALGNPLSLRLMRRMGGRYGIYDTPVPAADVEILYQGPDGALDRVIERPPGRAAHATWYLVRYAAPSPAAHATLFAREAPDVPALLTALAQSESRDTAWFLPADRPPGTLEPRARSAQVLRWDGHRGEVEHDGTCDLVIRRTYAPGWTARVNDGPAAPVVRVDGGLQGVRLVGTGPSRVSVEYRPPLFTWAVAISLVASAVTLLVLVADVLVSRRGRRGRVIA